LFLNLNGFSAFSSVNFVLFWVYSEAEPATDLATMPEAGHQHSFVQHRHQTIADINGWPIALGESRSISPKSNRCRFPPELIGKR
jgi:hypothetical protein